MRLALWIMLVGSLCALSFSECAAQGALPTGPLLLPSGIAYDTAGNLFVADARRQQVLELTLSGLTVVVAGTGEQGFAGDGGPSAQALLNGPQSVAVAQDGTVYIADTGNQRVRAVSGGLIRTIAGSGARGFSGDGGDARLARLDAPVSLALDGAGGVLIADSGNHRVRRLAGGVLTTLAGTGVQGFGGDGGAGTQALLDTPAGVAVAADGRVFLADSHNQRIRVVGTNGLIATFAGNGVRGFGGDGGAATAAQLDLPRGVAVTAAGDVIFADSDNQRLRLVDTHGVIRTVAGTGVQGNALDGAAGASAPLDSPRGIAVSGGAATVFADSRNRLVRELATDGAMYTVLAAVLRPVSLAVAVPGGLTYGQGSVRVAVTAAAPAVQGGVTLLDGDVEVSSASVAAGGAVLAADTLSAGQHTLTVKFEGDGLHGATVSAPVSLQVAAASVVVTAANTTMAYGSPAPVLTGTVTGVLARDAANAVVSFASNAPDLAPVGVYMISAALTGAASANYAPSVGPGSGALTIVPAAVSVAVGSERGAYAGLPLTLNATVAPATRGVPTGVVSFYDGGALVGTGTLSGGVASAVELAPVVGSRVILAVYAGDHDFLTGSSATAAITVSALPDFGLSVTSGGAQTVQGGTVATVGLSVAGQGAFSGSVIMSVSGLPPGATATFSPPVVVPGNGAAAVTLTIQTIALAVRETRTEVRWAGLVGIALLCGLARRRKRALLAATIAVCMLGSAGCGDRTFSTAVRPNPQTFPVTILATSTNLAGAVVTRTVGVTLIVQ